MKKNVLKIAITAFLVMFVESYTNFSYATATRTDGIEQFPAEYRAALYNIRAKYPNWTFTALNTGLNWNDVINNEATPVTRALVPNSYKSEWKCSDPGCYDPNTGTYTPRDGGGVWVSASRAAIEYAVDPRNYLDERNLFMFETLSYKAGVHTQEGVEKILSGSFMANTVITYLDANGNTQNLGETYSSVIMQAATQSGVSPYYIATKIRQEIGSTKSNSVTGNYGIYKGLYNYYNIGASPNADGGGAVENGLSYASGSGSYDRPWTNPKIAIIGGAKFIGLSYINIGQDTAYSQKFDVDNSDGTLYSHQYATNILDPYGKAGLSYNGVSNMGTLAENRNFVIPVYNNMSTAPARHPELSVKYSYQTYTNGLIVKIKNSINIYSQPDLTGSVCGQLNIAQYVAVSQRAYDANGTVSYSVTYDSFTNYKGWIKATDVENDGKYISALSTIATNIRTAPSGSSYGSLTGFMVGNPGTPVAVLDSVTISDANHPVWFKIIINPLTQETGYVAADLFIYDRLPNVSINFTGGLVNAGANVTGVLPDSTALQIKSKITTNLTTKIYNVSNVELNDGDKIGTGTIVRIKDTNGNDVSTYTIIMYGDVTGDGRISSADLLAVQKHILEIKPLTGVYYSAGNVSKNGRSPSAADLLKIQKHILEMQLIQQ